MASWEEFKSQWQAVGKKEAFSLWVKHWRAKNARSEQKDYREFIYMFSKVFEEMMVVELDSEHLQAMLDCLMDENTTNTWACLFDKSKWAVIAGIATAKALLGHNVDIVITNFKEMKKPIKEEMHVKKFLIDILDKFDIKVAFNNSESIEDLMYAYRCPVVVGLLDKFKEHYIAQVAGGANIRGNRSTDCLLFDDQKSRERLSYVTVSPFNVSGMNEVLNSFYTYIWIKLSTYPISRLENPKERSLIAEEVEQDILRKLFCTVSLDELRQIDTQISDQDLMNIWIQLFELGVLDSKGQVLVPNNKKRQKILAKMSGIAKWRSRIECILQMKLNETKRLPIPHYFLSTVERYLKPWINDAIQAKTFQFGFDFTFTDDEYGKRIVLKNELRQKKPWSLDRALIQFLELKTGCNASLSRQYFDSIFITTKTFLSQYKNTREMLLKEGQEVELPASVALKEKCFDTMLKYKQKLEDQMKASDIKGNEVKQLLWLSILDQWTLWFHDMKPEFDREKSERILAKLSDYLNQIIDTEDHLDNLEWVLPQRKLELAKLLLRSNDFPARYRSLELFDEVINETNCPKIQSAANYYKAYTHVLRSVSQYRNDIRESLSSAQVALVHHLRILSDQLLKLEQVRNNEVQFFTTKKETAHSDAIKSDINWLDYYLMTTRIILGKSVSAVGLCINGIKEHKASTIFENLIENGFVTCYKLNKDVLSKDVARRTLASYGIKTEDFIESLGNKERYRSETQLLKAIQEAAGPVKSRQLFWQLLLQGEALLNSSEVLIISKKQYYKLDMTAELHEKIEGSRGNVGKGAKISPSDVGFSKFILRDHSIDLIERIQKREVLLFDKAKLKSILSGEVSYSYYRTLKTHFLSTELAFGLDKAKLAAVNFQGVEPSLTIKDLDRTGIPPEDWLLVWNELVRKKIVDCTGAFKSLAVPFSCAQCPLYDEAIRTLIDEVFTMEIVRWKWMKATETDGVERHRLFSSIGKLLSNVPRQLASDLMEIGVIEPPMVAQSFLIRPTSSRRKLIGQLKKLSVIENIVPEREDRIKLLSYLNQSKSFFVDTKRMKFRLAPLDAPSVNPKRILSVSEDPKVFDDIIVFEECASAVNVLHKIQTFGDHDVIVRFNELQLCPIVEWGPEFLIDIALLFARNGQSDLQTCVLLKEGRLCPLDSYVMLKKLFQASF